MPTAVLYLRLSRDSETSDSLEGQEADCRRRAAELGATDVVVFKETVSGYRSVKRRAFDAMTSYVRERRPAFLIAWKFDRFSRQGIRQVAEHVPARTTMERLRDGVWFSHMARYEDGWSPFDEAALNIER